MEDTTRRLSWQLRSRHTVGNDSPFKQEASPNKGAGARKPSRSASSTDGDNGFRYSRASPGGWDQRYHGGGRSPVQNKADTPAANAPTISTLAVVDFLEVFFRFCFTLVFFVITLPMRLMGYALTFFVKICVYWVLFIFTIMLAWSVVWNSFLFLYWLFSTPSPYHHAPTSRSSW